MQDMEFYFNRTMNKTEQLLVKYCAVESGQPILCGHIFQKFIEDHREIDII